MGEVAKGVEGCFRGEAGKGGPPLVLSMRVKGIRMEPWEKLHDCSFLPGLSERRAAPNASSNSDWR